MNKNTIIALVVAVLAVAGTVIFLWQYDKKQNAKDDKKTDPETPATKPTTKPTTPASVFPLKRGSKGAEVKALQRKMNEFIGVYYFTFEKGKKPPYTNLSVDGDFGPKTEANVKFVFGTSTVTQAQYNKFLSKIIIPDVKPGNSWATDPINILNMI